MLNKAVTGKIGFAVLGLCGLLVVFTLFGIIWDIAYQGAAVISWEFLTQAPREGMTEGGIFPALLGTLPRQPDHGPFCRSPGHVQRHLPQRICPPGQTGPDDPAVHPQSFRGALDRLRPFRSHPVRPYFCTSGPVILSAGLTLGLLTLPWTITASEEALKTVPKSYRDGALALGATKWQSIRTNVLPYAIPGMLTGTILGLARAAGETAPILFTGAAFFYPILPKSLFDQFMALPYHLYIIVYPAPGHRPGPAHRLRHGIGTYRPGPLPEHGGRGDPLSLPQESPDGSIMVTIGIDKKPGNGGAQRPSGQNQRKKP